MRVLITHFRPPLKSFIHAPITYGLHAVGCVEVSLTGIAIRVRLLLNSLENWQQDWDLAGAVLVNSACTVVYIFCQDGLLYSHICH